MFGLLALLASPAAADPPNLPVNGVIPSGVPVVPVPAPVSPSESVPVAEQVVQSILESPEKPPAGNDAPVVAALGAPSSSGSSGNSVAPAPSVTVGREADVPESLDRTPPHTIRGLSAMPGHRAVTLRWRSPADADFSHVVVSRTTRAAGPAEKAVYSGPAKRFVDRGLTNGAEYRYVVVSYDRTGNRSAGVAIVAAPKAAMLLHPADGARVTRPPLLRWAWIRGATFYNVQLFRGSMRTKVMTAWPAANRLQLPSRWVYAGRRVRLSAGIYRWIVWPGFGRQIAKKYGPLLGEGTFTVVARNPSSQARAVDTTRTEPTRRPRATPVPALEPDLRPVRRERARHPEPAPARQSAPVLTAAPARKPAPVRKAPSSRTAVQPPSRAPMKTVSRVAEPVRGRTPAARLPASASAAKSPPLRSFAPRAAPSGIKEGLARLRWFFLAILGTGVVFLTAVASRRLSERRGRKAPSLRWRPPVAASAQMNGTNRKMPALSRRRCLIPGCRHEDARPAKRRRVPDLR